MNLKKISQKLEKMAFYVVILTMFQITVFRSILINSDYILRYLDMLDSLTRGSGLFPTSQEVKEGTEATSR